jgi:primosomal protein N' (replication factor Y)
MVAKGLDFPNVTLVGVVNADLQLALPDFRSGERTFQLLTQVAGRSGRGTRPGRVIIQTNHPDHVALAAAAAQDYDAFFSHEIEARRDPPYPPHRRLVNLLFDGRDEEKVIARAEAVEGALRDMAGARGLEVELLGPAPQPLSRLKGKHRWHLTLRGVDHHALRDLADRALADAEEQGRSAVRLSVDVDPASLL